jgi:SulP family sulfate permease
MFVPKLFTLLRTYDRRQLAADAVAGVVVGVVALPLSIAFAIASGVPPQAGLYTAIIAGAIVALLGGSRVQIAGPTGAFVVIVYGIVQQYGIGGLTVATMMAGAILIGLGAARLGGAIKFIPHPVVTGFTSGIALIIFTTQIRDLLGLPVSAMPAAFLAQVGVIAEQARHINAWAPLVAMLSLGIVVVWPRLTRRVPSPFVALIATTALVQLAGIPVETIGSRFGVIDASFPTLAIPAISLETMQGLVAPAFAIAMLGGIESLLSAVVADGMTGGRHRSNMELVAQGVANIVTPMFGGIPATGAIARTATNIRAGARTPVSGIVHSITLLAITLFVGRWVALIPMATIAGILVVVAWHMSEVHTFRATLRAPRSDVAVLIVTFALTVFVDLTVALGVGMVLASFLFMRKMAEVTEVRAVTDAFRDDYDDEAAAEGSAVRSTVPDGVEIYEIDGPFFFGAAETFKQTITALERPPQVLVLRMRKVGLLDATGLALLRELARKRGSGGFALLLSEVQSQPLKALTDAGLLDAIGAGNCTPDIESALERANALISELPPRRRSGSSRSLPSFGPE